MAPTVRPSRAFFIGPMRIGADADIVAQSMCSYPTQQIDLCVAQIQALQQSGAGLVRLAADHPKDVAALAAIRAQCSQKLVVDLQENYRLVKELAPIVDKVRYNPGHLHHHQRNRSWQDKVDGILEHAGAHDCALRIGVNCGSLDPALRAQYPHEDAVRLSALSAELHSEHLEKRGFLRYCVSIKDSNPFHVIESNRLFSKNNPHVPLHLGVTEAGLPPAGIIKSRYAIQTLLLEGIGDTIRVSLTVPHEHKALEITIAQQIIDAAARGEKPPQYRPNGLNIISCPSCSRVENEAFVELAQQVRLRTKQLAQNELSIAVMGCRVNGPGETDNADLGLWCGPNFVNLKRKSEHLGAFSYQEILPRLDQEIALLLAPAKHKAKPK